MFYFSNSRLHNKFEMTRSVNKTKWSTVLSEETRMLFDITWKSACKVKRSEPSDETIQSFSGCEYVNKKG